PPKTQQKTKEQKMAAAMAGGRGKGKKKWSKGKVREKTANKVLFDQETYDRMLKEVPKMKLITASAVVERLKVNATLARAAIRELEVKGDIKVVTKHRCQLIYTRSVIHSTHAGKDHHRLTCPRRQEEPVLAVSEEEKVIDISEGPIAFRKAHLRINNPPAMSPAVRATIEENVRNVYNPFISSMLSQTSDQYENLTNAQRIENFLHTPATYSGRRSVQSISASELTPLTAAKREALSKETTMGQALTLYAMFRLLACRELVGGSYSHIGEVAYGKWGSRMVQISIVLMQFGFCCSYIIFVAQNMNQVLAYFGANVSVGALIVLQTVVYIPLSWIRYISNLIADVFILYGVAYILGTSFTSLAVEGIQPVQYFNPQDYSVFIGTAVFTFEGIGLVIPTQASLTKDRQKQFPSLLVWTVLGLLTFYSVFASVNYMALGDPIQPLVLASLPRNGWTLSVQCGWSFAQLLSYPLFLFPAVKIIEDMLQLPRRSSGQKVQKNVVRAVIVIVTVLIAYFGQEHLDLFVSIVGAVCCVPLSFIYPPLFYQKIMKHTTFMSKVVYWLVVFIGIGTFVFVTYSNIQNWVPVGLVTALIALEYVVFIRFHIRAKLLVGDDSIALVLEFLAFNSLTALTAISYYRVVATAVHHMDNTLPLHAILAYVMAASVTLSLTLFVGFHSYLISQGQSTLELNVYGRRIPYRYREMAQNWRAVFGSNWHSWLLPLVPENADYDYMMWTRNHDVEAQRSYDDHDDDEESNVSLIL
ncbi:hypothetical protein DYB25_006691, partial [Aphanomyces astaci]